MELKTLYIESTPKTPHIDLNYYSGELIIAGKSIPENAALLYEKVMNWVNQYIKFPKPNTNLRLNLEYFNTATAIWLSKIIKTLCSIEDEECTLTIHLYFSIEDFDNMDAEDIKDELYPLLNMVGPSSINLVIKIYGTDDDGEILKESMVLV